MNESHSPIVKIVKTSCFKNYLEHENTIYEHQFLFFEVKRIITLKRKKISQFREKY